MAYKLLISMDAHNDVDDIVSYIVSELDSPVAAAEFIDELQDHYKRVIDRPHLYSYCQDERLHHLGYRKIVIKNYLVLYRIDEEKKTIYIVRVIYGRRNYPEML